MTTAVRIPPRDRDAVLQALRSGVVPRRGLPLIQVGRAGEIKAAISDIERIADGGAAVRFVIGEYGSGKSFLLSLIRSIAMEKGLVTLAADFNPDRRLYGSGGQARSLYQEMTRNLSIRSKPEGGALASVVERFVTGALQQAKADGSTADVVMQTRMHSLSQWVGGYDFAQVIEQYWRGHESGNDQLKSDALRWLRGEFNTKTDARVALGVRSIVEDDEVYDQIKLLAQFVRLAGYTGLLVTLDEMVNLFKIPQAQARNSNFEQILRILNDMLQGSVEGMGVLFGGTPESLVDTRRGLYSYAALQTRLAENQFAAQHGLQDYGGPVIRLASLAPEDLLILLGKLRTLQAGGDPAKHLVPDEALHAFLAHCESRIGAAYFQTPRASIRAWLDLLSVLEQHPHLAWQDLIGTVELAPDFPIDDEPLPDEQPAPAATATAPGQSTAENPGAGDDDFASFRL